VLHEYFGFAERTFYRKTVKVAAVVSLLGFLHSRQFTDCRDAVAPIDFSSAPLQTTLGPNRSVDGAVNKVVFNRREGFARQAAPSPGPRIYNSPNYNAADYNALNFGSPPGAFRPGDTLVDPTPPGTARAVASASDRDATRFSPTQNSAVPSFLPLPRGDGRSRMGGEIRVLTPNGSSWADCSFFRKLVSAANQQQRAFTRVRVFRMQEGFSMGRSTSECVALTVGVRSMAAAGSGMGNGVRNAGCRETPPTVRCGTDDFTGLGPGLDLIKFWKHETVTGPRPFPAVGVPIRVTRDVGCSERGF